ncbi:hypothetical protein DY000_02007378 [Brassica cretica]|uniref:Uncharacterized protein n=1 Tax=Brassica cretica TaxID=69181 RepID=A0ABQ7CHY0_BRACR|nr:hypothetical protein DY000_02007378 [Brassica cretica]
MGNLTPGWEGSYKVIEVRRAGAYRLQDSKEGKSLYLKGHTSWIRSPETSAPGQPLQKVARPQNQKRPKAHRGPYSTNVKSTCIKTLRATQYREHMVYLLQKYCEIQGAIKILLLQTWKAANPGTWVITPTPAPSKAYFLIIELKMSSSFNFPRPTTTIDDLEDLYTVYRVDRAVVLDLDYASETPKTVRGGYCGAYLPFFQHLVAFVVRPREEGLSFGLSEFRDLVLVRWDKQNPGTFLVSPRPGRHVIEDVSYRDEKWRKQFFVFKVDRASTGDFNFSRLPRNWAENIGGTNRPQPVIGSAEDEAERSQEVIVTSSIQPQSLDRLARQLMRRSSFRTSGSASRSRASVGSPLISIRDSDDEDVPEERRSHVSLSPGSEDDVVGATRKRRRSSKAVLPGPSCPRQELTVRESIDRYSNGRIDRYTFCTVDRLFKCDIDRRALVKLYAQVE